MPADFLLTNNLQASATRGKSGADVLFQSNQSDSVSDGADFSRDLEREVQRTRDSSGDDRRHSANTDSSSRASGAARRDTNPEPGGKSLPPHRESASRPEHNEAEQNKSVGRTATGTESPQRRAQGGETSEVDQPVENQPATGENTSDMVDRLQLQQQYLSQLEGRQLSSRQRQALESLNNQLQKLQLDKVIDGKQQGLLDRLQAVLTSAGLELADLAGEVRRLAEAVDQLPQLSADNEQSQATLELKDFLSVLGEQLTAIAEELETSLGMSDSGAASRDQLPALPAALASIKELAANIVRKLNSDGGANSPGFISQASGRPLSAGVHGTDLSALLTRQGSGLMSQLAPDGVEKAGASAAPWGISQLSNPEAPSGPSLAERLGVLAKGLKEAGHSETQAASPRPDKPLQDGVKDIEFIMNNADKLSLKAKQGLGELSLDALAEQARQSGKMPEGAIQQKLKEAVDQIKSALTESARLGVADTEGDTSSGKSGTLNVQPFSAFARSLEQANTAQQMQKTTMTMQNHFTKPGWAGELGQRLMMMVGSRLQVAEIRLDPPDLGPMEVKVRMQQEQTHVVFNSQHAVVRDALEQALPRLREMFEQNGLSLGDVDVQDQTAQQKESDENHDQVAGGLDTEGDAETTATETVTVTTSDRLVDFYA
ncbi:MAG: flagellar hook-length control protein FliK [Ketobacteraceae bacterium]|nr:flagellar hook-length control protein FliK [Ketobacteraceae bacterium]